MLSAHRQNTGDHCVRGQSETSSSTQGVYDNNPCFVLSTTINMIREADNNEISMGPLSVCTSFVAIFTFIY